MQLTCQSPWLRFYSVLGSLFRLIELLCRLDATTGWHRGCDATFLIFDTGDEIATVLRQFSKEQGLGGSSFKAIGAISYAKLGWFNWETKKYEPASVLHEQVELLSLIGDIAIKEGEPLVHAHLVVGRSDGTAHGGHLLEARVRPTCELILTESPIHLQKKLDPQSGIPLIQI